MNISRAIKLFMAAKDINNKYLSKKTGISKSAISMVLNNKRNFTLENIEKISEALGVSVVVLLMLAAEKGEISTLSPELVSELQKSILDVLRV